MRCREARLRIDRRSPGDQAVPPDQELTAHLEICRSCAEYFRVVRLLERATQAAAADDGEPVVPIAAMRETVESEPRPLRRPRRFTLYGKPVLKPAIGFGVAAMLLLLALVPFRYSKVVGYDIRFGGVRPELVQEEERICDMLHSLGLFEAGVDVLGCDTTCSLRIIDLKTTDEVRRVTAAFEHVNKTGLTMLVTPLRGATSSTLLDRAQDRIFDRSS